MSKWCTPIHSPLLPVPILITIFVKESNYALYYHCTMPILYLFNFNTCWHRIKPKFLYIVHRQCVEYSVFKDGMKIVANTNIIVATWKEMCVCAEVAWYIVVFCIFVCSGTGVCWIVRQCSLDEPVWQHSQSPSSLWDNWTRNMGTNRYKRYTENCSTWRFIVYKNPKT